MTRIRSRLAAAAVSTVGASALAAPLAHAGPTRAGDVARAGPPATGERRGPGRPWAERPPTVPVGDHRVVTGSASLLAKLQAIEFSATISVLRRVQSTWRRLATFSGIATALRKSAVESVGRFSAEMATEDIALAWQLQTSFHDVRYEPRAVFV